MEEAEGKKKLAAVLRLHQGTGWPSGRLEKVAWLVCDLMMISWAFTEINNLTSLFFFLRGDYPL